MTESGTVAGREARQDFQAVGHAGVGSQQANTREWTDGRNEDEGNAQVRGGRSRGGGCAGCAAVRDAVPVLT